jgi:hypothetical protein
VAISRRQTPLGILSDEIRETVEDFFDIHSCLDETLEAAVSERREMQQQLAERPGDQATQWIEDIDEIAPGSFDVLTVTYIIIRSVSGSQGSPIALETISTERPFANWRYMLAITCRTMPIHRPLRTAPSKLAASSELTHLPS